MMTVTELAATIDHTLLRPEATASDIEALCDDALAYGFAGVCVNPIWVRRVASRVSERNGGSRQAKAPAIVSIAGFPLGACHTGTKVDQTRRAIEDGATEIDMVIHVGALIEGDRGAVRRDIEAVSSAVHRAIPNGIVKVILETRVLTREQMILGCRCAAEGEADFVKTSTGFHPTGGATEEDVRLLHRVASPLKVKASGGIRTAAAAKAMIAAGASRIGTSSSVAIMQEMVAGIP